MKSEKKAEGVACVRHFPVFYSFRKCVMACLCLCLSAPAVMAQQSGTISLAGEWQFALDPDTMLTPLSVLPDVITLPGTTDTNRKGYPLSRFDETTHLSRRYSYKGRAWYSRTVTVPEEWRGKPLTLMLERTKYTEVYLDGQCVGSSNRISTPQRYLLADSLAPGLHVLTVMVSNAEGVPPQLYANSHAYTEDTQTNWNGIIGRIEVSCSTERAATNTFELCRVACEEEQSSTPAQPLSRLKAEGPVPALTADAHHFYLDGRLIFLRGKHDACVWPLTGHVPMDYDSWDKYFGCLQEYGINHVRFHSWCPPEEAFHVADQKGIILQPELPFWGSFDQADTLLMTFLHQEGEDILREYGHHRSFRMFALGNELWGNIEVMQRFVDDFRRLAPDKLYTLGSNYYLGRKGVKTGMDYFTTCRVGSEEWGSFNTHTRGSFSFADAADGGIINHFRPSHSKNFEEGCLLSTVPVISHETGQFQTYPDYAETAKYTGVLRPCNLEVFRQRLTKAGMESQAADFHRASGRWSYLLYKQDIEMDLRTPSMAGFQLLDLQDYPGQGTALVGILDAFMQPKGVCTSEEWRQFCSPVVPLLVTDSSCFTIGQGIHGKVQLANYSETGEQPTRLNWNCQAVGQAEGSWKGVSGTLNIPGGSGLTDVGPLDISLKGLKRATKLRLTLSIDGYPYKNSYDLWAYPQQVKLDKKGIVVAHCLTDEVCRRLDAGASVLLMPDADTTAVGSVRNTVGGLFQTDYWNYRMFKTISESIDKPVSPGTLGILCNPAHQLFGDFPTDEHTNWQWWPVIKESHPMILDALKTSDPILVQVIDNVERNHRLGLVFELKVGSGRLLVVMSNLEKAARHPEGRQLYASVLRYMHSPHFAPQTSLTTEQLKTLFTTTANEQQLEELNNISPY